MSQTTDTETTAPQQTDYEIPEWLSLDEDEEIQWIGEPAMISFWSQVITTVLLCFVLIGLLMLPFLPFSYLSLKNTDFVITNKALYVKKGVLSTNIESVGLDKIQNTEYSQSFMGKQFDFGSIDISTAGSSGAEITFSNIEDAKATREMITRLSNQYSGGSTRSSSGGSADGTVDQAPGEDRMDELIEELRATRKAMENVEAAIRETGGNGASQNVSNAETKIEWESDDS